METSRDNQGFQKEKEEKWTITVQQRGILLEELVKKGRITEERLAKMNEQDKTAFAENYLVELMEEADFVDELINQKVISPSTASTARARQINEVLRRFSLSHIADPRIMARYYLRHGKVKTTLGEPRGSDTREQLKKHNIIQTFLEPIDEINHSLSKKNWHSNKTVEVKGFILYGSRMDEQKKPRVWSDIDFFVITNQFLEGIEEAVVKAACAEFIRKKFFEKNVNLSQAQISCSGLLDAININEYAKKREQKQ